MDGVCHSMDTERKISEIDDDGLACKEVSDEGSMTHSSTLAVCDEEAADDETVGIQSLPDELLMLIFGFTSAYRDYGSIRQVCWRWKNIIYEVSRRHNKLFQQAVANSTLLWRYHEQPVGMAMVTERYSHSACYHDKSVYVFGGCASTSTTFNDLWRFDLEREAWIRPLASGSYPSPKACASFVSYKDCLILFGGWSHPNNYSFFQESKFFNQLHLYHPTTSKWTKIDASPLETWPRERAGHGVSVVRDHMIVIGGYQGMGTSTSHVDVWVLKLQTMKWFSQMSSGPQPSARYGHAQAALDDEHIAIVGGCGGPNMQLSDAWLLTLDLARRAEPWTWVELKVVNQENSVPQLMSHPACQIGTTLVTLNKNSKIVRPVRYVTRARCSRSINQSAASIQPISQSEGLTQPCCEQCSGSKRCHTDTSDSSSDNDDNVLLRRAAWCTQRQRGSAGRHHGARHTALGERCEAVLALDNSDLGSDDKLRLLEADEDELRQMDRAQNHLDPSTSVQPDLDPATSARPDFDCLSTAQPDPGPSLSAQPDHDPALSARPDLDPSLVPRMQSVTLPSCTASARSTHRPSVARNRQKQLEALKRQEERLALRGPRPGRPNPPPVNHPPLAMAAFAVDAGNQPNKCCHKGQGLSSALHLPPLNPMYIHRLDLSRAVAEATVAWLPVEAGPCVGEEPADETMFYTLVEGRGELLMFGGIQGDSVSMQKTLNQSKSVTRALYYIHA